MSEDEKKAIKQFKNFIYTYQDVIEDEYSDYEEKESAKEYQEVSEKILNLLEKQQKEIEELKNNELDYTTIYINGVYEGKKYYKDKIREKIKELEKIKEEHSKSYNWADWEDEDVYKEIIAWFEELLEEK